MSRPLSVVPQDPAPAGIGSATVSLTDFEVFFASCQPAVVRALTVAIGDRREAEDATQEGFAAAYRKWDHVRRLDRPVAWVYVVALNRARRRLGRLARAPETDAPGQITDPASDIVVGLTIRAGLSALTVRQRTALVLRFHADLTVPEVAAALGCSVGTAKSTIHQALARLRVAIEPDERGCETPDVSAR